MFKGRSREVPPDELYAALEQRLGIQQQSIVNPAKLDAVGMVVVHDLANTGSIAALQTADLGRRVEGATDGFEVLGRAADEEERGCSIAADALWQEVRR